MAASTQALYGAIGYGNGPTCNLQITVATSCGCFYTSNVTVCLAPSPPPPSPPPPSPAGVPVGIPNNYPPPSPPPSGNTVGFPWCLCNRSADQWGSITYTGPVATNRTGYVRWSFVLTALPTASFNVRKIEFPVQLAGWHTVANDIVFAGYPLRPQYASTGTYELTFKLTPFDGHVTPANGPYPFTFEVPNTLTINTFFAIGPAGLPLFAIFDTNGITTSNAQPCPINSMTLP